MLKEPEPEWLSGVLATHKFHVIKKRENPKWTMRDTAKALHKALGPVSEELKVAQWLRTHSTDLKKFEYLGEAIKWIRSKQHDSLVQETNLD